MGSDDEELEDQDLVLRLVAVLAGRHEDRYRVHTTYDVIGVEGIVETSALLCNPMRNRG